MEIIILIIASYLLGSIPFGFIIAGAYKIDIRKAGSGNIGATNLSRFLGKKWGYFCFALDVLKGFIPMFAASRFLPESPGPVRLLFTMLVGVAAVIGHIFPVYLKFRGGKGVSTSFGVALGFWPYYTICSIIAITIWLVTVFIWRYISLASIVAAVCFAVVFIISVLIIPGWSMGDLWPLVIISIAIPALVIIRHQSNIRRIITGTESKISFSQKNQKIDELKS